MAFYELRERGGEHARQSGRRVTEMIKEAKMLLEEICEQAELMEEEYGERGGNYGERGGYNERGGYGERDEWGERRSRGSNGRYR
ncbi:MAG: hypothetical protein MJZ96_01530 [Paludibacteraceae bacterium]|nr:hypothetical protein [Paludibacteraceae bacterium]